MDQWAMGSQIKDFWTKIFKMFFWKSFYCDFMNGSPMSPLNSFWSTHIDYVGIQSAVQT